MVLGRLGFFLVCVGHGRLYTKNASEHSDYGNLLPCDIEYTAAKVFSVQKCGKFKKQPVIDGPTRYSKWLGSCNIPRCLLGQV